MLPLSLLVIIINLNILALIILNILATCGNAEVIITIFRIIQVLKSYASLKMIKC